MSYHTRDEKERVVGICSENNYNNVANFAFQTLSGAKMRMTASAACSPSAAALTIPPA